MTYHSSFHIIIYYDHYHDTRSLVMHHLSLYVFYHSHIARLRSHRSSYRRAQGRPLTTPPPPARGPAIDLASKRRRWRSTDAKAKSGFNVAVTIVDSAGIQKVLLASRWRACARRFKSSNEQGRHRADVQGADKPHLPNRSRRIRSSRRKDCGESELRATRGRRAVKAGRTSSVRSVSAARVVAKIDEAWRSGRH